MKWILFFCFLFLANCSNHTTALISVNSSNQNENIALKQTPKTLATTSVQPEIEDFGYCKEYEQIEIPKTNSPIGKIDFNNLSYPKIWEKGFVKLKNGCFGEDYKTSLGGCEYTLDDVAFVDFNGDGIVEALVNIYIFCGAGSSSSTNNFFIYNLKGNKLNLLWKIGTGPRAYCGVKEYEFKDKQIMLELFGICTLKADGNFNDTGKHRYDYSAYEYTKFVFGWNGKKFDVKSREVFPFPENDIKEYFQNKFKRQNENNN